jgi:hypothetical protein
MGLQCGSKKHHNILTPSLGALPCGQSFGFMSWKTNRFSLKWTGYNLAPLADINNPNNPVIGYRSFGENKKGILL